MKPIQIALSADAQPPAEHVSRGGAGARLRPLLLRAGHVSHRRPLLEHGDAIRASRRASIGNWVGPFGAFLSDLLLQWIGFTAFLLPLWMGGMAWGWMRSRPGGSAVSAECGHGDGALFVPAVFALLPWHWRWAHAVPVEGVIGRLVAGMLVAYLNVQGAWIVASVLAAAGFYFASAISFWAVKETLADRWIQLQSWHDRWRNWRDDRADRRAEEEEYAGRAE